MSIKRNTRSRNYLGEPVGSALAEWIDKAPDVRDRRRILQVVRYIQRVTEISLEMNRRDAETFALLNKRYPSTAEIRDLGLIVKNLADAPGQEWQRLYDERCEIHDKLNQFLRKHYSGGYQGLSSVDTAGRAYFRIYGRSKSRIGAEEWQALAQVQYLSAVHGTLHRLRQCICGKWFYGWQDGMESCGKASCRVKKRRADPEKRARESNQRIENEKRKRFLKQLHTTRRGK